MNYENMTPEQKGNHEVSIFWIKKIIEAAMDAEEMVVNGDHKSAKKLLVKVGKQVASAKFNLKPLL